jgi:thiamine biosynthesis lipoprotein
MVACAVDGVPVSAAWRALGTRVSVFVRDPAALEDVCALVERELDEIDLACSPFRADSELTRVNGARDRLVGVSPLFLEALQTALNAARLTDGDVDPTVGRALRLLGYDRDFAEIGSGPRRRVAVTAAPGWRSVHVDANRRLVRVPGGVELDLGATAKALAADRAARHAAALVGGGVLVNLGGDVAVAGTSPPHGWAVRITDDNAAGFDATGQTVSLTSGGLATSSTTVRRWASRGEQLHHILDPATGRPATVVWRTVSVAAASCVDANTASTAAIVRGDRAAVWLESLGLPARLVAADGGVVRVGGWPAE